MVPTAGTRRGTGPIRNQNGQQSLGTSRKPPRATGTAGQGRERSEQHRNVRARGWGARRHGPAAGFDTQEAPGTTQTPQPLLPGSQSWPQIPLRSQITGTPQSIGDPAIPPGPPAAPRAPELQEPPPPPCPPPKLTRRGDSEDKDAPKPCCHAAPPPPPPHTHFPVTPRARR